jgi:hypothetical protein
MADFVDDYTDHYPDMPDDERKAKFTVCLQKTNDTQNVKSLAFITIALANPAAAGSAWLEFAATAQDDGGLCSRFLTSAQRDAFSVPTLKHQVDNKDAKKIGSGKIPT